jgi:hypothetical protein
LAPDIHVASVIVMKVSYHDCVDVFWPYTQTGKRLDQAA